MKQYLVKLTKHELTLLVGVIEFSRGGVPYYRTTAGEQLLILGYKLKTLRAETTPHEPPKE